MKNERSKVKYAVFNFLKDNCNLKLPLIRFFTEAAVRRCCSNKVLLKTSVLESLFDKVAGLQLY